jgi:hypothetical protein
MLLRAPNATALPGTHVWVLAVSIVATAWESRIKEKKSLMFTAVALPKFILVWQRGTFTALCSSLCLLRFSYVCDAFLTTACYARSRFLPAAGDSSQTHNDILNLKN